MDGVIGVVGAAAFVTKIPTVVDGVYCELLYVVVYDKDELERKLMEMSLNELLDIAIKSIDFKRWFEVNKLICSRIECYERRERTKYELNKMILEKVGVKYEENRYDSCPICCGCIPDVELIEPKDIVLKVAEKRGVDVY